MKKGLSAILIVAVLICWCGAAALAHPGRTDANGGHWDHKNGTYHYHNGPRSQKPAATKKPSGAAATPKPTAEPEELFDEVWYGETNKRNVDVYEYPSASAKRLTRIAAKGSEIVVVDWIEDDEDEDTYWYIVWIDGQEGYVYEDAIDFPDYDEAA